MRLGGKIAIAVVVIIIISIAVYFIVTRDVEEPMVVGPTPGPAPAPAPPTEPAGPCDEYTDDTIVSDVSVACLRKTLTDLGCSTTAELYTSIDDEYSGWLLSDGPGGTGTYLGMRTAIEEYVNTEDDVKRAECFGESSS